MAEALYHADSYLRDFDAVVVAVEGRRVALDRTAFYPAGGGQPDDRGIMESTSGRWTVTGVHRQAGEIWHDVDADPPLPGERIHGVLEWPRRYALMRTHTAMHILCGVIWRDYGASVTGGNMEPLHGRMDFEFEHMRAELVHEIEDKINAEVTAARDVRPAVLPREKAFEIPDLIRTKINLLPPEISQVRIVEIVGLDLQADGGTHVANTREVGPLRIVDYKSKGAINKRLVLELEDEVRDV